MTQRSLSPDCVRTAEKDFDVGFGCGIREDYPNNRVPSRTIDTRTMR